MKAIVIKIFILYCLLQEPDLIGNWVIDGPYSFYNYPEIIFKDQNMVELRSYGDTIFFGNFRLNNDELILTLGNNIDTVKINRFSNDSLILNGFKGISDTLIYTRNADY